MIHVDGLISIILLAIRLVALAGAVFALVHVIRQRKDAFTAVDKLTKPVWVGILAAATVFLLVWPSVIGLFGIVAIVAVCVYLVDVRPRVDEVQRGPRW
ncbi:DUF2516 family protein [Rhodococcus rhodnii]|uniref:Integral membrane protein n=2 Tax=Rhodococcus rhodnii TaxID=38312 RepID=R7WMX2_9NOCA|nr:DUF2516 family protein [Rhodococcus rhodnii]EOM76676.1 hypothetical protein Rrhod_1953 [Rhodococcus rhodnii LMG 5362]TXG92913.1 DUF2516 family protein [Rhodococcus rhodnii]